MKIVDAVWEKRNLGVDVIEINCEENDSIEVLSDALSSTKVPYSVVKVPYGNLPLLLECQRHGYSVVEMSIEVQGNINSIKNPSIYERFMPHIRLERAEGNDLNRILSEIKKGEVFATDRIAVDPFFSQEIAGARYYNWCKDILADHGFMGALYYKDKLVAFNLSKSNEDCSVFDGILGGVLPEFANKGLGFLVVHGENEICRKFNGLRCIGRVSSNNLPIFRLHLQYGYEVSNMVYVLSKHL